LPGSHHQSRGKCSIKRKPSSSKSFKIKKLYKEKHYKVSRQAGHLFLTGVLAPMGGAGQEEMSGLAASLQSSNDDSLL
ncbi:hypothetical protein, partial [Candidatus Merdisoma sp. JLR.KK006]|uniref:hypothetical protein n=1 Tax=Candidatus Merdisoma sp. JLR.KK006 TaxID=3112626 RepID=UPI002FEF5E07